MATSSRRVGLVLGCLIGGLVSVAVHAQQAVFRGEGDIVRVFVTVADRDGRLVTTLSQTDFEIRDEGRPQRIVVFDNQPQPIQLILLLDVSGSMRGNLDLVRAASSQLFARLLPGDRVKVGSFGRDIAIGQTFGSDASELAGQLPTTIEADAPTPLWRAIDTAMMAFDDQSDARRVVLVLSDGRDGAPVGFGRQASQAGVIDAARDRDVMVYAIGLRSRSTGAMGGIGVAGVQSTLMADMPDPRLARVAEETGGGYFELRAGDDLGAAFTRVADELHRQYLLGYAIPDRDGRVHDIDVRVSVRGLTPRARRSYQAPRGER